MEPSQKSSGLQFLHHPDFVTHNGHVQDLFLSYEWFGQELGTAPVVLVNHALTGNSKVTGEEGWWNELVGPGACIDTNRYTVLAFNVPGNGYDGQLIEYYKGFIAADAARLFNWGVRQLGIKRMYAIIGGSLGGGLAWEMVALEPEITEHLVPLASDWKSTDWLIANCQIQEQILNNSTQPVHDARMHAMLCYRTPESFSERFNRGVEPGSEVFSVESWLLHHGSKLQSRFELAAYRMVNQLLKTIDITRNGAAVFDRIREAGVRIHIISVNSDLFFTARENMETYRRLAQTDRNITYSEIQSVHGHDAFLMEFGQLENILAPVFAKDNTRDALTVLKFGGRSLGDEVGLDQVIGIIRRHWESDRRIAVVVSARGRATDTLSELLDLARDGQPYEVPLEDFVHYQSSGSAIESMQEDLGWIRRKLQGVALSGDYSPRLKDDFLARGELLSGRLLATRLRERGIPAEFLDARRFICTDRMFGFARVLESESALKARKLFQDLEPSSVPVVTGFLGSTAEGETTTLGRNGSNYTASLLANFLDASEVINYTHVHGIYSADPSMVRTARLIPEISFEEANELVQSGIEILHSKTILPLIEKNIPLRICNTFDPEKDGTYISSRPSEEGIKALSVRKDLALLVLEGKGLLGRVGIDARIFDTLRVLDISVGVVSQGASERGIGLVVERGLAERAKEALTREFKPEISSGDVHDIRVRYPVSVISVVGQSLASVDRLFNALNRNRIQPLLFSNTISGNQVSLLVDQKDLQKSVNVLHGQLYGTHRRWNLFVLGHGNVGATLIDQVLESRAELREKRSLELSVVAIANSRELLTDPEGIGPDWRERLKETGRSYGLEDLIRFAEEEHLENRILIDNSSSRELVRGAYIRCIRAGFDLVSSNKLANTLEYPFYQKLRNELVSNQRQYLYETNVGAGLPLIDTIKLLYMSGESITRIRGVFSGSLSYIFNRFSREDLPFSVILQEAMDRGLTEPDPREDLGGWDVGRKLLILARELALANELEEVDIQALVPGELVGLPLEQFKERIEELDSYFDSIRRKLTKGHALRYVGELQGDLQKDKAQLSAALIEVPVESPLGQIAGADSIIEIFTESYSETPLLVQGPGAGAAVTARGVFGDILRIAQSVG